MAAPRVYIDLDALNQNLLLARHRSDGRKVMAVVKANAYGHGLTSIGQHLAEKVDFLAVGRVDEGCELRSVVSTPIVVLQGCYNLQELRACHDHGLQPVVHTFDQLQRFAAFPVDCWLMFDTGMHRLGMPLDKLAASLTQVGKLRIVGLLTHLACADEPDHPLNRTQLAGFLQVVRQVAGRYLVSGANSAAILGLPAFHGDCVRPGIMLYGVSPFSQVEKALQPVMRLCAPVVAVRELSAGDQVGYGANWTATGDTRVAVLALGYADGYPREVSSGAYVLLRDHPCPLVGRVSMDLMTVDVSTLPGAGPGDEAVLWGQEALRVEQVAAWAGTIPYTLLTRVSSRVSRLVQKVSST